MNTAKLLRFILLLTTGISGAFATETSSGPLRLAVVGLTHGHSARFVTNALARLDVKFVGIVEAGEGLVARAMERHQLPRGFFHDRLDSLLANGKLDAVAAFNMTFEHLAVVEACAPRGVHVMVEKPLAVSLEHARAIERAATNGGIHVIVNYEPVWSPADQRAFELVREKNAVGEIRKLVAHDGNNGPVGKYRR